MTNMKDRNLAFVGSRSFLKNGYFFIILILAACIIYLGSRLVLVLEPEGSHKTVVMSSCKGDNWYISFTHSVEKTAWDEYFTVNGCNDMTMTHTKFQSLGWGFPYSASDGKFSQTADGRFQLILNRPYKEVALRISEQAMQHIVHRNQKYNLIELFGQGTAVTVKSMYRYQYWMKYYF